MPDGSLALPLTQIEFSHGRTNMMDNSGVAPVAHALASPDTLISGPNRHQFGGNKIQTPDRFFNPQSNAPRYQQMQSAPSPARSPPPDRLSSNRNHNNNQHQNNNTSFSLLLLRRAKEHLPSFFEFLFTAKLSKSQ